MIITPEKVVESKIELTYNEFDILSDYKLLLEKMRYTMASEEIKKAADITQEFLTAEINTVLKIMDKVDILPEV